MKLVINRKSTEFELTDQAIIRYSELAQLNLQKLPGNFTDLWYIDGIQDYSHLFDEQDLSRHDPALVQVVEELGDLAAPIGSNLVVIEIPDRTEYTIEHTNHGELVHELHRIWS